ncbi:MAG TPA: procyclic acidic repetitive family protein [Myxococcota bacterium]|nr:procyclic acidic repetitive family protein [Myxococcota bacterium]HRY96565.1 procyclic acidic repetitive family protein [Myxococcota bacterium]
MRARILASLCLACLAAAGTGLAQEAPGLDDFGVVPLVDEKAPRLVVWFAAGPGIKAEDARAVETQVLKDFDKRRDFRLVPRARVKTELKEAGQPELDRCDGGDACLLAIGRLLKADRMIGAELQRTASGYRLVLKSIDLKRKPPAKLNSVVEGSVSELLMGGLTSGVAATFDGDVEPVPIAEEGAAPAPRLATRPEPVAPTRPGPKAEPAPAVEPAREPGPGPGIADGGNVKVERLEGAAPGAEVQAGAPERPGFFSRHLGSVISLGIGLAAGGAGLGLGLASMDAQDSVEQQWDPSTDSSGRDQALAANILFGVAGAAAITAVVLFILEPGADDAPVVEAAPGGAAIRF